MIVNGKKLDIKRRESKTHNFNSYKYSMWNLSNLLCLIAFWTQIQMIVWNYVIWNKNEKILEF